MDYPGFDGGSADALPGGDPIMSGPEAAMHFFSVLTDKVTGEQKDALFSASQQMEDLATNFIEGLLTTLTLSVMSQMNQNPEWKPVVGMIHNLVTDMSPAGATGIPATAQPAADAGIPALAPETADTVETPEGTEVAPKRKHRRTRPVSGAAAVHSHSAVSRDPKHKGEEAPEVSNPAAAFREGRERGGKMTMGSIAKAVGAPLAKAVSDTETEWVPRYDKETGKEYWRLIDNKTGRRVVDPETNLFVDDVTQDDPNFDSFTKGMRRRTAIRSLAVAGLAGEGIAGSLGVAAARIAGPVGIAVGAVKAGGSWLENQEQAAQPYKAVYGEQTSTFAARERLDTWMTGLRGWGSIGTEEAREQYMRATQMGLTGVGRDEATGFSRDMMRKFGMSTDASMAVVQSAIQQGGGTAALDQFAEAITKVSRAAVNAGRASNVAISEFVSAQAALARTTPGSGAATQLATDITQMSMNMPESLSKALGGAEGIAGMLTQQNVMAMAAMGGQDPTMALFNMSDPNTAHQQGLATLDAIGDLLVRKSAEFLGMGEQEFRERLDAETDGKKQSPEMQFGIIRMIAGERSGQLILMLSSIATSFLGKPVEQSQIINLLFETAAGAFSRGKEGSQTGMLKSTSERMGGGSGEGGPNDALTGYDKHGDGIWSRTFGGYASQKEEIYKNLGYAGEDGQIGMVGTSGDAAVAAYVDRVAKTGTGSAAMEAILASGNSNLITKAAGVKDLDDTVLRLANGKDMTVEEAAKSGADLSGAAVINKDKPNEQPTSLISLQLDLSPEAKEVLVSNGPTDEQRAAVPPSGTSDPSTWTRQGR